MDTNHEFFRALSCYGEIETAMVSMFSPSDKYYRPPFLRFRFRGKNKDDQVYKIISTVVSNYIGKVRWVVTTRPDVKNYIIIPLLFEQFVHTDEPFLRSNIEKKIGEQEYLNLIDDAISDISGLAIAITQRL